MQTFDEELELGFIYCDKINGIPNVDLPLILAINIVGRNIIKFLVDNKRSYNILYSLANGYYIY